jgi:hypothetical protein
MTQLIADQHRHRSRLNYQDLEKQYCETRWRTALLSADGSPMITRRFSRVTMRWCQRTNAMVSARQMDGCRRRGETVGIQLDRYSSVPRKQASAALRGASIVNRMMEIHPAGREPLLTNLSNVEKSIYSDSRGGTGGLARNTGGLGRNGDTI